MSKFFLVTGDDLKVEEFDSSEEVAQELCKEVDDGEVSPMDCAVFEGEQLDFEMQVNFRAKTPAE